MVDTKALRSRILDMAIRGKLTEQLESDGTAEELYQQIQAEKQKLIKEGKIKKEKPLPPITPEEISFEIPENWKWARLGDITTKITSGSTPSGGKKGNAYVSQGFCFFREQNIYNDGIHQDGMVYINEELMNARQNSTVLADDLLLNITGGSIGRCAIIPSDFDKGSINQHILIIRLVDKQMRFYIHEIICSPYVQKLIKSKAVGDKDGFSGGRCKATLIPLPPLAEQKRIVERVEEIFRLLDTIDKAQEKYSADSQILKAKLITAGIQGKLTKQLESDGTAHELYQRIQEEKQKLIKAGKIKKEKPLPPISTDEIPFEIPQNWMWVRLGMISSKITDGEHKTPRRISSFCGYYLLSARNITNNLIKLDDVDYVDEEEYNIISKRCNPKRNDVLISCSGSIGRCCVVEDDNKYVMVRSAAMVSLIEISPKYVMYCIHSKDVQKQISYKAKATAQANLFQEPIKNLIIPLPPLAEQKRIAAVLEKLLGVVE